MIERIVRMSFLPDKTTDFLAIFNQSKIQIAAFAGCRSLRLMQDANDPSVFLTYSVWDAPMHLEAYRQSELFKTTWSATKALFKEKPTAWSVIIIDQVK